MKEHYKTIEEALKVERPTDKVVKILSNKFAITQPDYTDGSYAPSVIFCINGSKTVYSLCTLKSVKRWFDRVMTYPNIERIQWCLNHSANGKKYHYVFKTSDNRKWKHDMRRLIKLV